MAAREEWLRWRFIPNVLNAIAVNRRKLALKSAFLTWALVCLIVAVLLLSGYFIYAQFWNRVRL
jgi:Na+/proline symporter